MSQLSTLANHLSMPDFYPFHLASKKSYFRCPECLKQADNIYKATDKCESTVRMSQSPKQASDTYSLLNLVSFDTATHAVLHYNVRKCTNDTRYQSWYLYIYREK
jgi:hypothetical protein